MPEWDYGEEGREYPVQRGETWQAGQHVFTCGSMFGQVLMPPRLPYLVYADPPWTQSLLTGFYTKAGLPKPAYDWLDIYRRVVALAGDGQSPCFMEGGARQGQEVAKVCRGAVYESWLTTYYHRSKNRGPLHYCGPAYPEGLDVLHGRDSDDLPGLVMAAYPGPAVVLDPCAGRGGTAVAAEKLGWASVNYELHPNRMSAALVRVGQPARRVRIPVAALTPK